MAKKKEPSKRDQLIALMASLTISDFKSKEEYDKIYALYKELKGEPRKRERRKAKSVSPVPVKSERESISEVLIGD